MTQNKRLCIICMALMTAFFLCEQAVLNFMPQAAALKGITKGLASGAAVLLCALGANKTRTRRDILLTAGLSFCALGDVIINLHGTAGIALFGIGHVIFCGAFYSGAKPGRSQIVGYAIAVAIGMTALVILREKAGARFIPVMLYMLVLFAMVALSTRQSSLLRIGAAIFALSDLLLALNIVIGRTPLSRFISLGVYYVALGFMSISPWAALGFNRNSQK